MAALVLVGSAGLGHAQVRPPDAGLLQQDRTPASEPRRPAEILRPADGRMQPKDGPTGRERAIPISRVVVEGSTLISQEAWDENFSLVGDEPLTLKQMKEVAAVVQAAVQKAGRPFAVAYLPPQDLSTGELHVRVVEGRYGSVQAQGALAADAAKWMAPLRPGSPIGPELERQMLLLSEQPGVASAATVSPGANPGDADVTVEVTPTRGWGGEMRVDNYGNRYAGRTRVVGTVYMDRLLMLGDRLSLAAGTSNEGGGQGSLSYGVPLGARGVRLNLSVGTSEYQLGKEFDILEASGKVTSLGATFSIPLQVSTRDRSEWQSGIQGQRITNRQGLFETEDRRSNVAWTNSLQMSHWFAGGGSLWGRLSAEVGRTRLGDESSQLIDAYSARTAGTYLLTSFDASASRPMGEWALYGHVSGQLADRNLDPSKKFVLGGASGVRAWPASEGAGDDGVLAQVELRRRMGDFQPFVFADAGHVQFNHKPWAPGFNERTLAGAGIGLRMSKGPWQLEGTAGWRIGKDSQVADADSSRNPIQFWVSLGYRL
ncbi:Hemolysin activation/secretion protein [Roseateles sp. YR242]|uniref:ShlB/FhaC/HecB family hemolysin secretion/activation protein n=1 Tax=Roseateles sp. YR242 TaxID=1855305 RepID=UPI0008CB2D6C|nr:ShlB/FhaC/HecB family hemolysin secretion/activation protein [Roseateles sp. YR242]SEK31531.1 Hemolysin activation/secretion protein [Roseateles sp. YR242]